MFTKNLTHFVHSKNGAVAIEYGLGLALIGIVLIQGMQTTETATTNYMTRVATGGATPTPPTPPSG